MQDRSFRDTLGALLGAYVAIQLFLLLSVVVLVLAPVTFLASFHRVSPFAVLDMALIAIPLYGLLAVHLKQGTGWLILLFLLVDVAVIVHMLVFIPFEDLFYCMEVQSPFCFFKANLALGTPFEWPLRLALYGWVAVATLVGVVQSMALARRHGRSAMGPLVGWAVVGFVVYFGAPRAVDYVAGFEQRLPGIERRAIDAAERAAWSIERALDSINDVRGRVEAARPRD